MKTLRQIKMGLLALLLMSGSITLTAYANTEDEHVIEEIKAACQAEAQNARYPDQYYQECVEDAQQAMKESTHGNPEGVEAEPVKEPG